MEKLRFMMKKTILFFVLFLFFYNLANAQIIVKIEHDNSGGIIGENLYYKVKEIVEKSEGFRLVNESDSSYFYILLQSLPNPCSPSDSIIFSVVLMLEERNQIPFYLSSFIGNVGKDRLHSTSVEIINRIKNFLEEASGINS